VSGPLDVIAFFTKSRAELERRLPALRLVIRLEDRPG
jgi:hypothetical protein